MSRKRCPHPEKVKFTSWWAANKAASRKPEALLRAYRCRDHWHITHHWRT